ncbi:MAG: ketosteroid isomerase [Mycobacterium sp.]|nr:ketosteroid isomerase [Mycobacterium sp.]
MAPSTEQVLAATDALVAAFAATDTAAYFAGFSPDATFVFHSEDARLDDRAAYEALWASWLASGWRVESCVSSERLVQLLGDTAVLTHTVDTGTSGQGESSTPRERETIVYTRDGDRLVAVHEHLSSTPAGGPTP